MRKDYFRLAVIGFIASLILYFISYYFEHSGGSLVIALVLLAATIYIFILSIIRSKSIKPSSQPAPPSQTLPPSQPSPPSQTISPSQKEAVEKTPTPPQSPPPSPQSSTLCPTCGQPLIFLEDIKKWYCQNEKKIVTTESQTIEKELEVERQKIRKELEILDKHLKDGKVSKKVYKELKHKFQSRLEEIE